MSFPLIPTAFDNDMSQRVSGVHRTTTRRRVVTGDIITSIETRDGSSVPSLMFELWDGENSAEFSPGELMTDQEWDEFYNVYLSVWHEREQQSERLDGWFALICERFIAKMVL